MAYSVLSHGFVCLDEKCGFELEMDMNEASAIFALASFELVSIPA